MSTDEPEATYDRELDPGEPNHPTSCAILTPDGTRVECAVTRTGPLTWTATPPGPHEFRETDRYLIDRLPPGGQVQFQNATAPAGG